MANPIILDPGRNAPSNVSEFLTKKDEFAGWGALAVLPSLLHCSLRDGMAVAPRPTITTLMPPPRFRRAV